MKRTRRREGASRGVCEAAHRPRTARPQYASTSPPESGSLSSPPPSRSRPPWIYQCCAWWDEGERQQPHHRKGRPHRSPRDWATSRTRHRDALASGVSIEEGRKKASDSPREQACLEDTHFWHFPPPTGTRHGGSFCTFPFFVFPFVHRSQGGTCSMY